VILDLARSLALAAAVVASARAPKVSAEPLGPLHQLVFDAAEREGVSYALLTCIIDHEDREWDPEIVSPTNDVGPFQIHVTPSGYSLLDETPWAGGNLFDAATNISAGAWLIGHGYGPQWSTWRFCAEGGL
jgi:hypothetical protein